jgi:hypothetical protein
MFVSRNIQGVYFKGGGVQKMSKKWLSILLTVVMVFALVATAIAAPAPKPGDPAWKSSYSGKGYEAPCSESKRTDASGDKISSNAHSGDFPGIYFYWDDKQKNDGVLLVADEFFNWFKGENEFFITAKNSNAYWDYAIVKGAGEVVAPGISAYKIPRYIMYIDKKGKETKDELKNINMIFIGGDLKDAELIIKKVWLDEEGNVMAKPEDREATFNNPYVLGKNTIKINSLSGKKVTVTENDIPGFTALTKSQSVTLLPGDSKTMTFKNQKQYANITIEKYWLAECDCDDCVCEDCIDITGLGHFKVLEAPENVPDGLFQIDGTDAKLGSNQVKEGTYVVSEQEGLLNGFKLISGNNVEVAVAAGESATVTFYNLEKKALPPEPGEYDPITSDSHADMWFDETGVLCLAGNTTTANPPVESRYFVTFTDGFWDKNTEVKIAFGSSGNNPAAGYVIITKDSIQFFDTLVPVTAEAALIDMSQVKSVIPNLKPKHTSESWTEESFEGYWFTNPFGKGAMHAYLIYVK